jgi:hypothetical protein
MIGKTNALCGGIDISKKPPLTFDGKWSGWHVETYEGKPYWEALFSSSGVVTNSGGSCKCDAWGIGGGGAGGQTQTSRMDQVGTGGASGYTNMVEGLTIPANSTTAITIGAGGGGALSGSKRVGEAGGDTSFQTLTCAGGSGGDDSSQGTYSSYRDVPAAKGGSDGGVYKTIFAGENGTPGDGKIMSKFWSVEHNHEYGAAGTVADLGKSAIYIRGGGGGGYLDVGSPNSHSGHGYGAGGCGYETTINTRGADVIDWLGKSGCLMIRIPI